MRKKYRILKNDNGMYVCKKCGSEMEEQRVYCKCCSPDPKAFAREKALSVKLQDAIYSDSTPNNKYGRVRRLARLIMEDSPIEKKCCNCGYDKHVEVCHRKPIADFELTAEMREINSISNLAYLCPNCHWEHDNGLLQI